MLQTTSGYESSRSIAKDTKGRDFLEGVTRALEDHSTRSPAQQVCLASSSYRGDTEGENTLLRLLGDDAVDIVLGPSDSGVYSGALARQQEWLGNDVPVVSSLVTASDGNESDGWFFRTNVDDAHRLWRIVDGLRPLGITSMALLYADTGFGRNANKILQHDLEGGRIRAYEAVPFDSGRESAESKRQAIKQVLAVRPEVVGMVGTLEDIEDLREQYRGISGTRPYDPILFTIIDATSLVGQVPGLLFVKIPDLPAARSGDGIPWQNSSEVISLAYDTAWECERNLVGN